MKNIKMAIKDGVLKLEVNLRAEKKISASGKTMIIASSQGQKSILTPEGEINLNLYVYTTIDT